MGKDNVALLLLLVSLGAICSHASPGKKMMYTREPHNAARSTNDSVVLVLLKNFDQNGREPNE